MEKDELKRFVYVSIISADNDEFTEEVKQEILHRFDENKDINQDWEYVLEPIEDVDKRNRLTSLLKS